MAEELAVKRLRYFNHQFLRVEDFQEEQDYHLKMRRRLNRVLHTWGVAEGLQVTAAAGAGSVKVSAGTAIDEQGREIVLLTDRVEPLGTYGTRTVYVTIRYLEDRTDDTDETGTGLEGRRWTERPEVRIADAPPARQGEVLVLARLNLAANGTVASVDDGDVAMRRRYAGVVGGDLEVRSLAMMMEGRPPSEFPLMRWGAAQRADLTGSLRVTQNAAVEGTLAVTGVTTFTGRVAVGIGATAPRAALHVPESGLQIGASGTAGNNFHFASDEAPAGAPRGLRVYAGNAGAGTHLLTVTAAGRVGVGTTVPAAQLHATTHIAVGPIISGAGNGRLEASGPVAELSLVRRSLTAWPVTPAAGDRWAWFNQDGTLRLWTEAFGDALSVSAAGNVGIGTITPAARVQVVNGAIMPMPGHTASSGIMFPENIGGGTNDAAWIRYYSRGGDGTTFEIGTSNDPDDHLALMVSGNVGVGTTVPQHRLEVQGGSNIALFQSSGAEAYMRLAHNQGMDYRVELANRPGGRLALWTAAGGDALNVTRDGLVGMGTTAPQDRLHVHGALRILTDGNPIRFTSGWSGHADANKAEIANDTATYKSLMVLGNTSGGGGRRRVGVWDDLTVHGNLVVNQHFIIGGDQRIYSQGRMHLHGEELLYLLNKGGTIVSKAWGGNGNLTVEGLIGAGGQSPTPRNPGWGGGIHTWDLEAEGTIWCKNDVLGRKFVPTGADLAENYPSPQALEPADVVSLDPDGDGVVLSTRAHDAMVLGVVSSYPGVVLNGDVEVAPGTFPIGLCGRVPCKVVDENGPIRRGDLLTSSSTPGHAMRAEAAGTEGGGPLRPGAVIGKALGELESGSGVIEVFVLVR